MTIIINYSDSRIEKHKVKVVNDFGSKSQDFDVALYAYSEAYRNFDWEYSKNKK